MKRKIKLTGSFASASSFIVFLHCTGNFNKFMANVLKFAPSFDADNHLANVFKVDPSYYLRGAFVWHRTPEGNDFWSQVNSAWAEYRKPYDIF